MPGSKPQVIRTSAVIFLAAGILGLLLIRQPWNKSPNRLSYPTSVPTPSRALDTGIISCGGLAGIPCPASGYDCRPEGNFPDAMTVCTPTASEGDKKECVVGGCSGELCSYTSQGGMMTPCIFKPEYACYKSARCEVQGDGTCGWTLTPELKKCLDSSRQ